MALHAVNPFPSLWAGEEDWSVSESHHPQMKLKWTLKSWAWIEPVQQRKQTGQLRDGILSALTNRGAKQGIDTWSLQPGEEVGKEERGRRRE
jgi:hypothetical protein